MLHDQIFQPYPLQVLPLQHQLLKAFISPRFLLLQKWPYRLSLPFTTKGSSAIIDTPSSSSLLIFVAYLLFFNSILCKNMLHVILLLKLDVCGILVVEILEVILLVSF